MSGEMFSAYTPVPSGNQTYLERPRLNRLLERATQKPLVNVVAGAGYGKTHSVRGFIKTVNAKTVWIQLTERDNRSGYFWEHLITALADVAGTSAETKAKTGTGKGATASTAADASEEARMEALFEKHFALPKRNVISDGKYIFVFDDFHLVADRKVLCFFERFFAAPHLNLSSIVISRKQPDINLKKLSAQKLLARIAEDELRFSRDEMVAYFRLQHISPAPGIASAVYRDTEGWPFAIHLASLYLRNDFSGEAHAAAYAGKALRHNAFKFIESEIMSQLDKSFRRFLIKLSLIENLNPFLLGEIAGDAAAKDTETGYSAAIEKMEEIRSFIYFDEYINAYHIHQLFLDYLREHQDELSSEEKKEVLTKTAVWCAANNRKIDAVVNYGKTGDYNGVIEVLFTLPLVLTTDMAGLVLEILDRTPENVWREYPRIIPIRARALISLGRHEEAQRKLLEMFPLIESLPERREKHNALRVCNLLLGFIGFIMVTHSKRYDFIRFFKAAADESKLAGTVVKAPLNGINIGFHVCRVIDPLPEEIEKFIAMTGEMVPYTVAAMGGCQYGMYELAGGEYAFYRGMFTEAEKLLRKAMKMGREKEQYEIENRALFYLLRIHLAKGNVNETEIILKQLEAELQIPLYMNRHFHYDIVTGWYYIQTGRNDLIAPWLKSDYLESGLNTRGRGLEKLTKAKYCFSEKNYPAALAFLESRENMDIFLMSTIEIKVLEAACRYRLQDRAGAYKALEDAYSLASPAKLFMPFTELGKDMRTLIEAAVKDAADGSGTMRLPEEWLAETRRNSALYAKKIYRLTGTARSAVENHKGPPLSHRETDVLIGLSQGLTREEIAESASISPNTVKSVIRSVYNKLGALNRADAVRIATSRGILP